jgi:phosphate transport system permease protein
MAKQETIASAGVNTAVSVHTRRGWLNGDAVFQGIATLFAGLILVIAVIIVITTYTSAREAIAHFGFGFLTTTSWDPNLVHPLGALTFLYGTVITSLIALALAAVVGVGVALLLVETRLPSWLSAPVSFLVELLAAIPSIVFGVWGFFVLIPFMTNHVDPVLHGTGLPIFGAETGGGASLLTASLILAVMIVPTIAAISRDVIRVVPDTLREGMLALGATRWEVIRQVVLPTARAGIIGGLILALGRAVGETIAVTMVIGNQPYFGPNLLASADSMASRIASNYADSSGLYKSALFELGLILFVLSVLLNVLARLLVWSISRGSAEVA